MTLQAYALVDAGNVVQNVVQWDGDLNHWQPPANRTAVAVPAGTPCGPGFTFTAPSTFTVGQLPEQLAQAAAAARHDALTAAIASLRQWATDASSTVVTTGNNNAVTQTVVNRFGTLCDRMADLLQNITY